MRAGLAHPMRALARRTLCTQRATTQLNALRTTTTRKVWTPSLTKAQPSLANAIAQRAYATTSDDFGVANVELAKKLEEEISFEKAEEEPTMPEKCVEFLKTSGWKLKREDNGIDVQMEKEIGNERLTVSFSVLPAEESADDDVDPEVGEEEEEKRYEGPMDLTVDIVKTNDKDAGALTFHVSLDVDASFYITDVLYCADASLIINATSQADEARAELYQGPRYLDLDEAVQDKFAVYLADRDFGLPMCDFMQEYAGWKEQRLYLNWLENVKSFVEK